MKETKGLLKRGLTNPIILTVLGYDFIMRILFPSISMAMFKSISTRHLTICTFITAILTLISVEIWERKSESIYKHSTTLLIVDCLSGVIPMVLLLTDTISFSTFYVLSLFMNIPKAFLARIWNRVIIKMYNTSESREEYDNAFQYVKTISTLLGSGIASVIIFDNNINLAIFIIIIVDLLFVILNVSLFNKCIKKIEV